MTTFHVFICILCYFTVTGTEASAVLEVSGHVDGEISIRCSGNWTTNGSSGLYHMYFCKEFCSGENIVIQTVGKRATVTQRGRYKMAVDQRDGSVNVTIEGLERADAGTYHCGVGKTFIVMYQEVNLIVLGASTVPPGSAPSTTSTQTEAVNTLLFHNSSTSSTTLSSATLPPAGEKTNQEEAATKLTDTTVVIIVSVSLAFLVCAIIPLIFYAHCRSNPELQTDEAMKGEADHCDGASAQDAVRLQPLQKDADAESSGEDASQYAAIYQALDPQSLD